MGLFLLAASAQPSAAQETCDFKSFTATTKTGARYVQAWYCGDGDSATEVTCTNGSRRIRVLLPFDLNQLKAGEELQATFTLGKTKVSKSFRATPPVKTGGEFDDDTGMSGVIDLEVTDPLWKALRNGDGIFTTWADGDYSAPTDSGIRTDKNFRKFLKSCKL